MFVSNWLLGFRKLDRGKFHVQVCQHNATFIKDFFVYVVCMYIHIVYIR